MLQYRKIHQSESALGATLNYVEYGLLFGGGVTKKSTSLQEGVQVD